MNIIGKISHYTESQALSDSFEGFLLEHFYNLIKANKLNVLEKIQFPFNNLNLLKLKEKLSHTGEFYQLNTHDFGIVINNPELSIIHINLDFTHKGTMVCFILSKNYQDNQKTIITIQDVLRTFIIHHSFIEIKWFYSDGIRTEAMTRSEWWNVSCPSINYPNIEKVDLWVEKFLTSQESLLVLQGPSGTGKTKLIQYILEKAVKLKQNKNHIDCFYTTDKNILESGGFFTEFIASSSEILVAEDIDFHLKTRKSGNTIMYYLLNISDGLLSNKTKKIILSTNISSIRDIDEALIRKGRCFAIQTFNNLNKEQAHSFLKYHKKEDLFTQIRNHEKSTTYSLATLYHLINTGKYSENKQENFGLY